MKTGRATREAQIDRFGGDEMRSAFRALIERLAAGTKGDVHMFTGIISDVGEVLQVEDHGHLRRLRIGCGYDPATIELGASLAHAGSCLTVVDVARAGNRTAISVDVGAETLALTTAGRLGSAGTRLNLERSLRLGDELGGHMVSGHVDGVAEIVWRRDFDGMAHFKFRAPAALAKFIAQKGSVALDGTSLTVNAVEGDAFEVLLDSAYARRHHLGRAAGRRSRQYRSGPDGALRGAAAWRRAIIPTITTISPCAALQVRIGR